MEISQDDEELINLVLSTDVYNDLFDELLEVGSGETVNDTMSNMPLFHHHRLLYVNQSTYDREEEKRSLFLNIATQVLQSTCLVSQS